jgi:hypothetical protein
MPFNHKDRAASWKSLEKSHGAPNVAKALKNTNVGIEAYLCVVNSDEPQELIESKLKCDRELGDLVLLFKNSESQDLSVLIEFSVRGLKEKWRFIGKDASTFVSEEIIPRAVSKFLRTNLQIWPVLGAISNVVTTPSVVISDDIEVEVRVFLNDEAEGAAKNILRRSKTPKIHNDEAALRASVKCKLVL